jgi:hypothetical protein
MAIAQVKSILTTLLVALLVQPAAALARGRTVLVPPGDSAASQYVETIPTDRGGAVPSSGTQPASGAQPGALTPGQRRRLAALGPDGQTLVAVVQATSPPPAAAATVSHTGLSHSGGRGGGDVGGIPTGTGGPGSGGPSGSAVPLSAAGVPSTAGLMLSAATGAGSGGLGIFLPLLLAASALGLILYAIRRWRARAL